MSLPHGLELMVPWVGLRSVIGTFPGNEARLLNFVFIDTFLFEWVVQAG